MQQGCFSLADLPDHANELPWLNNEVYIFQHRPLNHLPLLCLCLIIFLFALFLLLIFFQLIKLGESLLVLLSFQRLPAKTGVNNLYFPFAHALQGLLSSLFILPHAEMVDSLQRHKHIGEDDHVASQALNWLRHQEEETEHCESYFRSKFIAVQRIETKHGGCDEHGGETEKKQLHG